MALSSENALRIGPLRVLRATREDLGGVVVDAISLEGAPVAVAFCNAHTAEIALGDPDFAAALQRFVLVNDGVGMEIAAKILGEPGFPANLNGTDFVPWLFSWVDRPLKVYLLGAKPGVAAEAGRRFASVFPHVQIAGARDGYFSADDESAVVAAVASERPDLLLVAFGNPKQEKFIARHFDALGAKSMFGVGALFDFTAGRVRRAPEWVRRSRMEWMFRLVQEPGRLVRRYTVETGGFLLAVLRLRLSAGPRKNP